MAFQLPILFFSRIFPHTITYTLYLFLQSTPLLFPLFLYPLFLFPLFLFASQIQTLPTIVLFRDGIAVDRIVGFEELGGVDDFPTKALEDVRRRTMRLFLCAHTCIRV